MLEFYIRIRIRLSGSPYVHPKLYLYKCKAYFQIFKLVFCDQISGVIFWNSQAVKKSHYISIGDANHSVKSKIGVLEGVLCWIFFLI